MLTLTLLALAVAVSLAATSARSDYRVVYREKASVPCARACVPEADYLAAKRLAAKRLALLRRANRRVRAWHRAAIFRQGFVRAGLLCIHFNPRLGHGEGAWTDAGDPYWGGLQMDRSFMATYGRPLAGLGLANRWPPEAQLAVGTIAYYAGRGFYPWPNTARGCGLL